MAFVKTISPKIKSQAHLSKALDYIRKEEKASDVYYHNCSDTKNIAREFLYNRLVTNQNKGILASHICQSFSPEDNITPELARKIGKELIEKCFPDFQVVMATHTDGNHIHNHFIINSVSLMDGKKFYENKTTLNQIKKVSDELCYQNNLRVIEKDYVTKYSPVDQATMNAAKRGKSWKIKLLSDLDAALNECKNKNEFINFFLSRDYEIKFTNKNISFRKHGEKKSIRADTLAKQFGMKYSKEHIEKRLNIQTPSPQQKTDGCSTRPYTRANYYSEVAKMNWQRYEKTYAPKYKRVNKKYFNRILFSRSPIIFTLRLILYLMKRNENKQLTKRRIRGYRSDVRIREYTNQTRGQKILGNIGYSKIVNTPGNTVHIRLYSWQIAKLLNEGILLSSKINLNTGVADVTLKEFDLLRAAETLDVSFEQLTEQAEKIKNRKTTAEIKKRANKLSYLVVSAEQVEAIREKCIQIACYKKGEKYNIAFAPDDKEKILSVIYNNRDDTAVNEETFYKRNLAVYRKIKQASEQTGEKLSYKIVLSNQYKLLRKTTLEFAVFRTKGGKYNVVFLDRNKLKIEQALGCDSHADLKSTVNNQKI